MPCEHHISQQKAVSRADNWNGRNWVQGHDRQRTVSVLRKHAAGAWAQASYSAPSYSNHQTPGSWDGYRQMEAKHLGRFNDSLLASTLTRRASAGTGGKLHARYTALPRILYRERTSSSADHRTKYLMLYAGTGLRLHDEANTGSLVQATNPLVIPWSGNWAKTRLTTVTRGLQFPPWQRSFWGVHMVFFPEHQVKPGNSKKLYHTGDDKKATLYYTRKSLVANRKCKAFTTPGTQQKYKWQRDSKYLLCISLWKSLKTKRPRKWRRRPKAEAILGSPLDFPLFKWEPGSQWLQLQSCL